MTSNSDKDAIFESISRAELLKRLTAQNVSHLRHAAFICPFCKTIQSAASIMHFGKVKPERVDKILGFVCEGRLNNGE